MAASTSLSKLVAAEMQHYKANPLDIGVFDDTRDLAIEETFVDHKNWIGRVSTNDALKYGQKSQITVKWSDLQHCIVISGKTFHLAQNIKGCAKMESVEKVKWHAENKEWCIELDARAEKSKICNQIFHYLNAIQVLRAKEIAEKKRLGLARARGQKAKERERKALVVEQNLQNAPMRGARLAELVAWRQLHASRFEGPFSRGNWYNACVESDRTTCPYCDLDMLNYYGSPECPFSTLKPDRDFLEYCFYCKTHLFNNWN